MDGTVVKNHPTTFVRPLIHPPPPFRSFLHPPGPMATISSPRFHCSASSANPSPSRLTAACRFLSLPRLPPSRHPQSTICCCQTSSGADDQGRRGGSWDALLRDAVKSVVRRWEDYVASLRSEEREGEVEVAVEGVGKREEEEVVVKVEWNWDRWKKHFVEIEEQERIVSFLRSQLNDAVYREDYKDASKLQRAIAAAVTNDAVGGAIKRLNRAIEEEQYREAANIRDTFGTGLIGWWAGTSKDSSDPHGRIIRITAEHGRYVARSFSSRELASGRPGFPLFEIYYTVGDDGDYRQQAVYLKRKNGDLGHSLKKHPESVIDNSGSSNDSSKEKGDLSDEGVDNEAGGNDSDITAGLDGIQNVLQDMIPGVKVKVVKILSPGKVDRDVISKVIEQIIEEVDDDEDFELENIEGDVDNETESDTEEIVDSGDAKIDTTDDRSDLSVNFVVSGLMQNFSVDVPSKDLVRVPAKLEKQGRFSFSFSISTEGIEKEFDEKEFGEKERGFPGKVTQPPTIHSANLVMSDLAKVVYSRKRIPLKVLKDVGELINLAINQDRNQPPLRGTMCFNRINIPNTSDPLSGLYVSARGMFSSEVLYLKRKFGQWQEDDKKEGVDLQFYEYVEALKLTGDPSVPAGQVAFRAKIGKQNQLPHKGIIPEEFGVVARYKGQGRLAEPGFQDPRWVDGELVILDGKYIREGPVIGFVYWAPEYHFLMFFNRLRLQT